MLDKTSLFRVRNKKGKVEIKQCLSGVVGDTTGLAVPAGPVSLILPGCGQCRGGRWHHAGRPDEGSARGGSGTEVGGAVVTGVGGARGGVTEERPEPRRDGRMEGVPGDEAVPGKEEHVRPVGPCAQTVSQPVSQPELSAEQGHRHSFSA